ncbi:hypothetical protein PMIT1313_01850 [Prochlorococcus marinus str. MIT 1313]|nr:hypothetical protein PMIT1313_01850 [Prochlorococcus marinus str. MIT 1313]KZR71593.1 hypothetical protein PMIT1318_01398 [Prochlorococcus marinus str. MIT 1318]
MVVNLLGINIGSLCLIVSAESIDSAGKANQFF